eukprot:1162021-Pelagomonas_calceolata.AAC.10
MQAQLRTGMHKKRQCKVYLDLAGPQADLASFQAVIQAQHTFRATEPYLWSCKRHPWQCAWTT